MTQGNAVSIVGNTTRDPEVRFTKSGTAVAVLSVAVSRRFRRGEEWEEETSFVDVKCWSSLAENVAESVPKGTRVVVEGRLEQESWEDRESGAKRSKLVVVADEVSPSLRWASAAVTRNPKAGSSGKSSGGWDDAGGEEPF